MDYLNRAMLLWPTMGPLGDKPLDKDWKGTPAQVGPHRYTPLRQSLEFKTSAALLAMLGGCMIWGHMRLRNFSDSPALAQLAEALFCYQVDPLYLNPIEIYRYYPNTDGMDLPAAALRVYPWIFFERFFPFPRFWPIYPPIIETARAIYLTESIMPKRDKSFSVWIEGAIKQLNLVAPFKDSLTEPIAPGSPLNVFEAESRRAIGIPLGPSALLSDKTFDPAENAHEVAELLSAADPVRNPFLRDATEMKASGFIGIPYVYQL